jgi:hypothetical protein
MIVKACVAGLYSKIVPNPLAPPADVMP